MKIIILFFTFICITLISVFNLPVLNIKEVNFNQKTIYVNKKEFAKYISSFKNKNIFKTILFYNTENITTAFPEIKSISINRKGINKLSISIKERKAWISCIIEGKSFFIDKQGVILTLNNQLSEIETENVFIVKGLTKNDLNNSKIKKEKLKKLIDLKNKFDTYLPNHSLLIEKNNIESWNLTIDDNITILFGKLNNFDTKFNKIFYFLNKEKFKNNRKIDYIDCRINNKLLVSYAK